MNAQELLEHYARVRARLNNPPNAKTEESIKPTLRLVVNQPKPRGRHHLDRVRYALSIGPIKPKQVSTVYDKPIGPDLPSGVMLLSCEVVTPSAKEILFEVAEKHGLTPVDLVGPRRQKDIVAARFEAITRIADEKPDWSYTKIARFFNRDHTTVIHAVRKVKGTERDGRAISSNSKTYGGAP